MAPMCLLGTYSVDQNQRAGPRSGEAGNRGSGAHPKSHSCPEELLDARKAGPASRGGPVWHSCPLPRHLEAGDHEALPR